MKKIQQDVTNSCNTVISGHTAPCELECELKYRINRYILKLYGLRRLVRHERLRHLFSRAFMLRFVGLD